MDPNLTIRQYRGNSGFSEIRPAWHELMNSVSAQCFYHHPAWFTAYFDRPGAREDMCFRCAFADDRLVAVLPLHFEQKVGGAVRVAKPPDYDGLYMPDMAVSDEVSLPSVWREMSKPRSSKIRPLWDLFSADAVLEGSALARSLFSAGNNIVMSSAAGRCAVVDVLPYDEVMRRLTRKFRGNLSNAKNRLSKETDVEFIWVKEPNLLSPAFDEFVDMELSGWKGKPERIREKYPRPAAIGLKQQKYDFYRNVVREFGELGAFNIFMLKIRGKLIGAQLFIVLNTTSYLIKTSFDEAFGRYSPGHLVLDFAINLFAEGGTVKKICFITDYDWFKYWNPRYANYLRIKGFSKSMKGRSASIFYSFKR